MALSCICFITPVRFFSIWLQLKNKAYKLRHFHFTTLLAMFIRNIRRPMLSGVPYINTNDNLIRAFYKFGVGNIMICFATRSQCWISEHFIKQSGNILEFHYCLHILLFQSSHLGCSNCRSSTAFHSVRPYHAALIKSWHCNVILMPTDITYTTTNLTYTFPM